MALRKFDPLLDGPPFVVTSLSLTPALIERLERVAARAGYGGGRQRSAFYRLALATAADVLEAEYDAEKSKTKR